VGGDLPQAAWNYRLADVRLLEMLVYSARRRRPILCVEEGILNWSYDKGDL